MAKPSSSRRPSERENAAAAAVCIVLGAAFVWLLHEQARMSPAVSIAFHNASAAGSSAPMRATPPDLVSPWPAALRPMSAAEAFSPATLSDKIDGKAEVYLAAGFVGLRCQRVALANAPGTWIELFVFDMGKPVNAFSVFSSQKRADVTDFRLADYAYRAGNELVFVHGSLYVELIATDEAPATIGAANVLATAYVAATAVTAHADVSADEARFPRDGFVAGSVKLLSADVFGFDGLKDVFVAHYRDGPDELTLFVARRATAADAVAAAAALHGFFVNDCGGKDIARPPSPAGAAVIDSGGSFDGVFTSGAFLAGVHQAPSRESAERWLQRLDQSLAVKQ
jgi:hypothetical protein